jgi:hypothetical protein
MAFSAAAASRCATPSHPTPPSREREEEGDQALLAAGAAERSVSMHTGVTGAPPGSAQQPARSGMPAASGPSGAVGGGTQPAKSGGTFAGTGTVTGVPRPSRVRLGIRLPAASAASREPGSASKEAPGSPGGGG